MGVVYLTYWRAERNPLVANQWSLSCGKEWGTANSFAESAVPGFQLGPDCNLNHTIVPFSEDLIGVVDLIEREAVRQQRGQI
jgi:hypothetical protein